MEGQTKKTQGQKRMTGEIGKSDYRREYNTGKTAGVTHWVAVPQCRQNTRWEGKIDRGK